MNAKLNTVKKKKKDCDDFYILLNASCPSLCLNAVTDETNSGFLHRQKSGDFSSNGHARISFLVTMYHSPNQESMAYVTMYRVSTHYFAHPCYLMFELHFLFLGIDCHFGNLFTFYHTWGKYNSISLQNYSQP